EEIAEITEDHIAEVLANWTGIPVLKLTRRFLLRQLENRNTRPVSQDFSNVVFGDLCNFFQVTRTPLLFLRGTLFVQLPLSVTQPGCLLEVLRINRSFLFLADFCDAIVYIAN